MMQDMLEEVRAQFTTKLMGLVRYFQVRGRQSHCCSEAAAAALAAAVPAAT
jgi:hypothetical protein